MKFKISILLVILSFLQVSCKSVKKTTELPNGRSNKTVGTFWSHRYHIDSNVAYGNDPDQRLDIYTHGDHKGEPVWFVRDEEKKPTLIYIHGGGWTQGRKETEGWFFAHYLERGWNVVNVEYRLGNGTAPNAAEDALLAVKWVVENAEKYKIDTNNIVLTGGSAGGHLALYAGLINTVPNSHPLYIGDKFRIQAIINWFGITEIEKTENYLRANHPNWNYALAWIKDKDKVAEISKKYSPIHYVTKNAPPILTLHGDLDELAPYENAKLLHERLDKVGAENQLLTLKGGRHLGFTEEQFQLMFKTVFEFLEAHP